MISLPFLLFNPLLHQEIGKVVGFFLPASDEEFVIQKSGAIQEGGAEVVIKVAEQVTELVEDDFGPLSFGELPVHENVAFSSPYGCHSPENGKREKENLYSLPFGDENRLLLRVHLSAKLWYNGEKTRVNKSIALGKDWKRRDSEYFIYPLARLRGLEPPTSGSEVRCSIQLSYRRNKTGVNEGTRTPNTWIHSPVL